jgi:tetratricopeptide (TPR) repeat protein
LIDPQFALPHVGLAENYHILASFLIDPREGAALGRRAAERALELDPSLPEAHAWLAVFSIWADFDWKEARRRFDLALSRQPVLPGVLQLYGYFYLRTVGRAKESVEHIRRGLEQDPLNLIMRVCLASSFTAAGDREEGLAEARKILDLDPGFVPAYTIQAMDVTGAPFPEALAFAEKGYALAPWNPISAALLAGLLMRKGDLARAGELMKGLGDGRANAAPVAFAIFHLLCGEVDKAAGWTERAIGQRHNMVVQLLLAPPWKPLLRTSVRWPELARMMNLPAAEA